MADLASISRAAGEALRDAEAKKAAVACQFLRCVLPELFRELAHRPPRPAPPLAPQTDFTPTDAG